MSGLLGVDATLTDSSRERDDAQMCLKSIAECAAVGKYKYIFSDELGQVTGR